MVNENEFKLQTLAKQVEIMTQFKPSGPPSGAMMYPQDEYEKGQPTSLAKYQYENEIKFLKDLVADERNKRENQFEEHLKLYANMQSIVHGLEGEIMRKLKDHRSDQLSIFQSGEDERQRIEKLKVDRSESDVLNLRNLISTLDRRLEDEAKYRSKNEEDIRRYIENKMIGTHEKLKGDEKMQMEREKRLLSQF